MHNNANLKQKKKYFLAWFLFYIGKGKKSSYNKVKSCNSGLLGIYFLACMEGLCEGWKEITTKLFL